MSKNKKVTVFCKYGVKHGDVFLPQKKNSEISEELFKELEKTGAYKRGVIKLVKKETKKEVELEEENNADKK